MSGLDALGRLPGTYRRLERFRQILRVMVRYGFGSLFEGLRGRLFRLHHRVLATLRRGEAAREYQGRSAPERLRLALVELGPTFVKLGQIMATRRDLVPAAYAAELAKLQDSVPPFAFTEVRRTIREELGDELEAFFTEFEERPVGAASMAQGHRARLRRDGTLVFVKVQRPNIGRTMRLDLEILEIMADALARHSEELAYFRPKSIVAEFRRSLEHELDFAHERSNQEKFAQQFAGRSGLKVPRLYPEYCTHRLLVMEFISGIPGTDVERLRQSGMDLRRLSATCADIILEQFFEHGFFHADPHPGNIFFLPGNVLCYIDFGQMGRVTEDERHACAMMLRHIVQRNYKACVAYFLQLTERDGEPDLVELERGLGDFAEMYLTERLAGIRVADALIEIYDLCRRQHLRLKPQFYLFLKAMGVSDDLGRQLNPDFQLMQRMAPYVKRAISRRLRPKAIVRRLEEYTSEMALLLHEAPATIRSLTQQLQEGRLTLKVDVEHLENMDRVFDGVFNRLSSAIVMASLVIGSSIVVHANPKPHWYGTSIMGVIGFLISGVLGAILLFNMLHRRN